MDTILQKEVTIPAQQVNFLERQLVINGFKNFSVCVSNNGTTAVISFEDEAEYTVFILKDILKKAKEESGYYLIGPDFDFMIRLEKKLKSYSKFDEFFIRKKINDL